jgi:two-component system, LuxR family, response regulator FixJ
MTSNMSYRCPITIGDEKLAARCALGRVVLIDDDSEILEVLAALLDLEGYACETYHSALAYLQVLNYNRPCFPGPSCIVCDVRMPELDGLELQSRLAEFNESPLLLMSGASGAEEAARAFRAGAIDFLVKPIDADVLLAAIGKALQLSTQLQHQRHRRVELMSRFASLTERERQIARLAAQGRLNRDIAEELNIALRTVKLHRQRAMEKLDANTIVELARIADEGNL